MKRLALLSGMLMACGNVGGGAPAAGDARPAVDAAPQDSATVDARRSYGTGPIQLCLTAPPPDSPMVISQPTTVQTDPSVLSICTHVSQTCVIAAKSFTISAALRAVGPEPLVLVASDSITVTATGTIDVASH